MLWQNLGICASICNSWLGVCVVQSNMLVSNKHLLYNMHGKNIKVIVSSNLLHVATWAIFLISYKFCVIFAIVSNHPLPDFIQSVQRWSTMTARYDILIMSLFWCKFSFCIDSIEQQAPTFLTCDEVGIHTAINMMSLKQWLALFTLLILYIFLGATFYYYQETHLEAGTRLEEYKEGLELQSEFINKYE